jgi:hypothetical protein
MRVTGAGVGQLHGHSALVMVVVVTGGMLFVFHDLALLFRQSFKKAVLLKLLGLRAPEKLTHAVVGIGQRESTMNLRSPKL